MRESNALFYLGNEILPMVKRADKCTIWDEHGNAYLDACSGAITTNMGHNHAGIKAAMIQQMDQISFSYRTQFESHAAVDLAHELVQLTDNNLQKVYFVGSGSEAVESALKLAIQYFYSKGESQRHHFISLRPSYHGSTLGALGLTCYKPLEEPFKHNIIASLEVAGPNYYRKEQSSDQEHDEYCLAQVKELIQTHGAQSIAGIVIEPIGGASTGARVLSKRYLEGLRELCDQSGALLIMDEVLTGFGRTGYWFAWQGIGVVPDIMALAKGLGAGYYPIGAMMARQEIVQQITDSGGFMHGHTYAGNPLACATGLAVINAMKEERIIDNTLEQGARLEKALKALKDKFPIIGDVRGQGLLWALEFVEDPITKKPFASHKNLFTLVSKIAKSQGLLVYPRRCLNGTKGDHILITPPLIIDRETLDELIKKLTITLQMTLEQL